MLGGFGKAPCSLLLAKLATSSVKQPGGRKGT